MIDDDTVVEVKDTIDDSTSDDNDVGLNEGIEDGDVVYMSFA
jgi:hypothetical protein